MVFSLRSLRFLISFDSSRVFPVDQEQKQEQQQRKSSWALLPPIPTKKQKKVSPDHKPWRVSHSPQVCSQSSYGKAVLNGINALCGVRLLSTPNAVKEEGWAGLFILFVFAVLSWYTGFLLCLDSKSGMETYPYIGQDAFGTKARFAISMENEKVEETGGPIVQVVGET